VHELALISKLARVVVVSVSVLALEEHLANKVERIRTAADTTIGSVKIYLLRNRGNSRVVIACVIKHKVANSIGVNTKLLQRLANNFSYLLAAMSAC
jgi:hypothetical protein